MQEFLDNAADSDEMTDDIAITERAIARTKMEDKAYWRVIARWYLGRLPFVEIALFFNVSEYDVKQLFLEAKGRIGQHICDIENGG